ncbi:MAG: hypothetical protein DCO96_08010 [Fluviicola sp. XM-24bin1]|nr:MAG: hypothetical protein DCO96_08010 [Fluviicola sp. XM-24bin1]
MRLRKLLIQEFAPVPLRGLLGGDNSFKFAKYPSPSLDLPQGRRDKRSNSKAFPTFIRQANYE